MRLSAGLWSGCLETLDEDWDGCFARYAEIAIYSLHVLRELDASAGSCPSQNLRI